MSLGVSGAVSNPRAGHYKGPSTYLSTLTSHMRDVALGAERSASSHLQIAGQFCPVPPGPE